MHERLQQFLAAENLSQSQFADTIGVARASISHILNGRNKPGFDFILSMSKHFPSLNIEWLITGKGRMYKDQKPDISISQPAVSEIPAQETLFQNKEEDSLQISKSQEDIPLPKAKLEMASKQPVLQRSISKIVVFYDDNSYQELK